MRFQCPNPDCRATLKAKPEQVGKRFRCPKCKTPVTVPGADELESGTGESISAVDTHAGDAGSTRDTGATRTDAEDAVAEIWMPGDVILDLYEVKEILGEGGFGTVFKIHHRGWNTDLAVKSPRSGHFKSDREKKNFIDECQTWIDLGLHPHAVSCYYVRTLGGIPRVFTELVDGNDLKHWIYEKKTKNVRKALDIAIQIAWGMAFAHEKGMVHRDLKPANVLMTSDGTAKVTDFGLARHGIVSSEEDDQQPAAGIQVSTVAGTPGYMAPEQASAGGQIDHRADFSPSALRCGGCSAVPSLGPGRVPWLPSEVSRRFSRRPRTQLSGPRLWSSFSAVWSPSRRIAGPTLRRWSIN